MTRAGAEGGFSFVETLVALAIIAAMTGVFFQSVVTSALSAQSLEKRREAVMLAHSLLAEAATPSRDLPGRGVSGRLRWTVTRRAAERGARDGTVPLEELRIAVADAGTGRRLAEVRTLRLGR